MATRSVVVLLERRRKTKNGYRFGGRWVYGHWDGYPEGVGLVLSTCYFERERAEALISLGDFSALEPFLSPEDAGLPGLPHSFNNPLPLVSIFYGRDRGEEGTEAKPFSVELRRPEEILFFLEDEFLALGAEYAYLGVPKGNRVTWLCRGLGEDEVEDLSLLYPPDPEWREKSRRHVLLKVLAGT